MKAEYKKIVLLANNFPSERSPARSPFNYNLAQQLSKIADVEVIVFRTVGLRKIKPQSYIYNSIKVKEVYLPIIPFGTTSIPFSSSYLVTFISTIIASICIKLLNLNFKNCIFHSISAGFISVIGDIISRKNNSPHFIQLIGSDVNIQLPIYKRIPAFRAAVNNAKGIISNSKSLANNLSKSGLKYNTVKVIYRGANRDNFRAGINYGFSHKTINFLYLGGIIKSNEFSDGNKKGGITLFNAWSKDQHFFTERGANLYFGGPIDGYAPHDPIINDIKSKENVFFLGEVSPSKVSEIMDNTDILLIPSMREGLPNICMEGMCAAKAIIASDTGGIPEIVKNGSTGLLVEPGNENKLLEAMKLLASDEQLTARLQKNAEDFAKENLDGANYGQKVFDFYFSAAE